MRKLLLGLLASAALTLVVVSVAWAVGELTQKPLTSGCLSPNGSGGECATARSAVSVDHMVTSPDGKQVYVRQVSAVAIFDRDPATGALTQDPGPTGCLNVNGGNSCTADPLVANNGQIVLTSDGRHLYVAANDSNTIGVFNRDPATGHLTKASCVSDAPVAGCDDLRGLGNVNHLALSPDDSTLYGAGGTSDTLTILDRNPTTGALSQSPSSEGCVTPTGSGMCGTAPVLDRPSALDVSPDGKHLYVSAFDSDAIVVFDREADGDVTQKADPYGCISATGSGGNCLTGTAINQTSNTLEVSPDGKSVYATSWGNPGSGVDALLIFDRDTTDGRLTQEAGAAGCISNTGWSGCQDVRAFALPVDIEFGPNGNVLYAGAYTSKAIGIFDRDAGGGLTQRTGVEGCVSDDGAEGCRDGRAIFNPDALALSPDCKQLYSGSIGSIAIFDRAGESCADTGTTTTPTTTTGTTTTGTTSTGQTQPPPASTPVATVPAVVPPRPVVVPRPPTFDVAQFVTLPSSRKCVSRRRMRVTLKVPAGARVRQADVSVNGKRKARRSGAKLKVPVDLTGLPKGSFAVKIVVTLADGRTFTQTRRFRTCTTKKKRA